MIEINITEQELDELRNGKDFYWDFDDVKIHLFVGEEEDENE